MNTKANLNEALFSKFENDLKAWNATITKDNGILFSSPEYIDEIQELRVEGHTSRSWKNATSKREIYLKNMQLSQERAYKVLSYCYSLDDQSVVNKREWLEKHFRANGMAFSKLRDEKTARRVEFTIQMKSEDRVYEMLK